MKPIKPALIALIVAAIALPAAANLRAPRKVDGTFSGSLAAGPAGTKLRLMGERLSAAFPRMSLSQMDPMALVYFQVEYEIENGGEAAAEVPLREVPGCAWGNGSTYKGEFAGGMPADVLTFLIWFDESAAAYVR